MFSDAASDALILELSNDDEPSVKAARTELFRLKPEGWSDVDAAHFKKVFREFYAGSSFNRARFLDRLSLEMPHKTKAQIVVRFPSLSLFLLFLLCSLSVCVISKRLFALVASAVVLELGLCMPLLSQKAQWHS